MPQLTSDWPDHTLRGPKGPKVAQTGLSGVSWARQGPVSASQANLVLLRPFQVIPNMTLSISEPHFAWQIFQPPNIAQKWFCIQSLHMDLGFQKEKMV